MRILLVDDEQRLASLLRRVLNEERYTVDVAYDGAAGLNLAVSNSYDLFILDRMLPDMNGLHMCRLLRADYVEVPIMMLSARGAVEDRVMGLALGADDYLVKPFAMEELLARVSALVARGRSPDSALQLRAGDLTLDLTRHEARRAERIIELTAKEFEVLQLLMRHPGHVLTRAQIIDHVWHYNVAELSTVVDTYIRSLRDKIDRGFSRRLIKTVRGVGYKIDT